MDFSEPPPADQLVDVTKSNRGFWSVVTTPWRHWFNLIHLYLVQLSNPYHAYGGFQDKAESITIAGADTWAWITNATNDLWTGLEGVGMSLSGDIMTITNGGDYSGVLSATLSALNGKDFQIRLYNITQASQESYIIGATTTGAANFTNVTLPLYIEASAGDTFRMEVQCTTDGTDPTFRSAVFYLQYLHD